MGDSSSVSRIWLHGFLTLMAVLFGAWTLQELWDISPRALVAGTALLGAVEFFRRNARALIESVHTRLNSPT